MISRLIRLYADIKLTVVTVIQVVRLMMIIICVPLLIYSPLFASHAGGGENTTLLVESAAGRICQRWRVINYSGRSSSFLRFRLCLNGSSGRKKRKTATIS